MNVEQMVEGELAGNIFRLITMLKYSFLAQSISKEPSFFLHYYLPFFSPFLIILFSSVSSSIIFISSSSSFFSISSFSSPSFPLLPSSVSSSRFSSPSSPLLPFLPHYLSTPPFLAYFPYFEKIKVGL
jgi:hypothetical protein